MGKLANAKLAIQAAKAAKRADYAERMQRAADQEFNRDLYHGTYSDIDEFDPDLGDIGTHLGTREQANNRLKAIEESRRFQGGDTDGNQNIIPVKLREGNSLLMEDVGMWNRSDKVLETLIDNPEFSHLKGLYDETMELFYQYGPDNTIHWMEGPENREILDEVRTAIQEAGYDSIKYKNAVENAYGMSAAPRPENQARTDEIWRDRQAIYDAADARKSKSQKDFMLDAAAAEPDPDKAKQIIEEWSKAQSDFVPRQYTPEEQLQLDAYQAELNDLDKIVDEDSMSYIALDPSQIRSVNAQFDPGKKFSPDLLAGIAGAAVLAGQSEDAEAKLLTPIATAISHLAKGGKHIDVATLTPAEKSALTKYGKELQNATVRRRETMRRDGETVMTQADLGERKIIRPEDLQGNVLVPVVGDRSRTGATVSNVGGVPLDRDVRIEGGPDFPLERDGTGLGWASMLGAARSKQSNIHKAANATGMDPVGVYSAMGDEAINFSTPVAEAMLAQIPALKIPKKEMAAFNRAIKKHRKDFVGVDSPDVFDQILGRNGYPQDGAGALRKMVIAEMSKDAWKKKGFPVYSDVADIVTDPGLTGLNTGDSGYSMFDAVPDADLALNPDHQSYNRGIRGSYAGGFEESVPPEVMFPDVMDQLSQQHNVAGDLLPRDQQIGALRAKHLWQPADQKWVDGVSKYMEGAGIMGAAGLGILGASAPGQAEAADFSQRRQLRKQNPSYSPAQMIIGSLEPLLTIGSAIGGAAVAGIGGLMQAANPLAPQGAGAETVENLQNALTYMPQTQLGQENLQQFGDNLNNLQNAVPGLNQAIEYHDSLSNQVADDYGPAAGTAVRIAPDLLF